MKKRLTILIILIIFLTAIIFINTINAAENIQIPPSKETNITLKNGKNIAILESPILVSELMSVNPEIQAISYYDSLTQRTIGYVSAFGGIGSNFLLSPTNPPPGGYEIIVSKNTVLRLPLNA